jgi:hypothetical protein
LFSVEYFPNMVSWTICIGPASNSDPPDLCLQRSQDYRHETPVPCSYFKCIFIVHRGFTIVFQPWICCNLIGLTPSITLS